MKKVFAFFLMASMLLGSVAIAGTKKSQKKSATQKTSVKKSKKAATTEAQ